MKRVSLKDIARIAGVSTSAVSFVLNGKADEMRISKAVAVKIISVAKRSGYNPNQVAVSLRTGQTKILGLIVENIADNFFASLAKIIEDESIKYGYKVVYCSTENNIDKGRELIRMLSQRQVDGYIIVPTEGMEKDIQQLISQKRPVVLMDRYFPRMTNVPFVLVNNIDGVGQGMKHLLKKKYKKIGFVTVDLELVQMLGREKGYRNALKLNGIPFDKKLFLKLKYDLPREDSIRQITAFLKGNKEMEAVFFATNYLGIFGLECIKNIGLRIPDDIAVICFDDHDIFRLYPPGITCIEQPIQEIATTAIDLLMDQLKKVKPGEKKFQVQLKAKVNERGST